MTANLPIFFLYYYYHHLVISIPIIYVDCTVYCVCVQCTLQYQTNWNMVVFPYWLFVQTFIYPFPTKTYYGIYFQDVTKMLKTTSTANNSFGHWPASVCLCGKDRLAKWLIWWIDIFQFWLTPSSWCLAAMKNSQTPKLFLLQNDRFLNRNKIPE